MRFADCVPIMIYDPEKKVIALVHAGWKGVALDAPGKAVKALGENFSSIPADLTVGLGPAICAECYPIGVEVAEEVKLVLEDEIDEVLRRIDEQEHLDLPLASRRLLEKAGVRKIETSDLCTAMDLENWFSHRAENGHTGRFGALLALEA